MNILLISTLYPEPEDYGIVNDTKAELTSGGVPVFRDPQLHDAAVPEAPVYAEVDNTYLTNGGEVSEETSKKQNDALEKLKAMANSISGDKRSDDKPAADLSALAKQAAELKNDDKKEEAPKKSGGLEDLLKKAKSIK